MNQHQRLAEIGPVARSCLSRAHGQHGLLELPAKLDTATTSDGKPAPCNAGTLFEIQWFITRDGRIKLTLYVDGVRFANAVLL